jgi:SPP1 family predicted phage head-tail adaptor
MIYSGHLREQLNFYNVVEVQSGSGFKHTEEIFKFMVRAERTKNRENYTVDADELFHSNELTFRLRYRPDIKETDIVEYEGQRYRITSLDKYIEENQLTIIISKIND